MLSRFLRTLLCGGSALVIMSFAADVARAQTALPEISVTAPGPIRRHVTRPAPRPARVATRRATAPMPLDAPPPVTEAQRGTLPVVADEFATVTVVPSEELRRNAASTMGDQLFSKPGITGSGFAPGAASRPIIRGLDGNRVRIVENGTDNGGVSDLGEDHFVPVDPLATDRVEVIRGPAALRWGSTSIGGVVSATNNRIPEAMPCGPTPQQTYGYRVTLQMPGCMNVETRSSFSTADGGIESGILIDAGGQNVAFHGDAYGRRTSDYSVPGDPSLSNPGPAFNGRQANSAARSYGGSLGGSYIFDGGFIGASITHNNSLYGISGLHAGERERIDAAQTRINVKGEYHLHSNVVDAVRLWAGVTDYKHRELGLEDESDPFSTSVHQVFTAKSQEGRAEIQFMPFNARFAEVTTGIGISGGHQELTASSPENSGSLYNGLFDPNANSRAAGYMFNEFKFTPATKAQLAGRIEHVNLRGTTPNFPADFVPDGATQAALARRPSFTPASGSIGLLHQLPGDLVASLTGQYVERAPKPAELFSRGEHHATGTFDIGNPNLRLETAQTIEAGLRKAKGAFRFEATAYYTRFNNFIYRRLTGLSCGEDFASCHSEAEHGDDDGHDHGHAHENRQAVYSQRAAVFRGGEFQSQLDVLPIFNGKWGIETQFDIVRATFTDGTNVPRIPPMRFGGGLFYRDANWFARINLLHAYAQRNAGEFETDTQGYNLLRAELSYTTKLNPLIYGAREITAGIYGNNLLNEKIRNAVSFTKDEVLMPGASVRVFANLKF